MLPSLSRVSISYGQKQILVTIEFFCQAFCWLSQTTYALVMGAVEAVTMITMLHLKSNPCFN